MKVVVTGGTGMIGRKLISSLLATPELIDRDGNKSEVTSITAFDVMPPDPPLPDDDRLSVVTGEISNAEAIASLICDDTDAVFHLAAVLADATMPKVTRRHLEAAFGAKIYGALNLRAAVVKTRS